MSFDELVQLFSEHGEMRLYAYLQDHVRPVSFSVGRIVVQPGKNAPPKLALVVSRHLNEWTGQKWVVEISDADGDKTLTEQRGEKGDREKLEASKHPRIQALLESFPESEVIAVRNVSNKGGPIVEEGK